MSLPPLLEWVLLLGSVIYLAGSTWFAIYGLRRLARAKAQERSHCQEFGVQALRHPLFGDADIIWRDDGLWHCIRATPFSPDLGGKLVERGPRRREDGEGIAHPVGRSGPDDLPLDVVEDLPRLGQKPTGGGLFSQEQREEDFHCEKPPGQLNVQLVERVCGCFAAFFRHLFRSERGLRAGWKGDGQLHLDHPRQLTASIADSDRQERAP